MDRPALAKLLEDVRARKIDVIVVYKVDRLTRSLADFAKVVELFDEHDVSFISVTQAFNTTTSMGRLRHKGQIHDGLHSAIIDLETWDRVQRRLAEQTQTRAPSHRNAESFLTGKLYDDRGNRMGPSHAAKGGRRWRYYISQAILTGRKPDAGSITRVPAAQIEKQVFGAIQSVVASKRSNEGFGALSLLGLSGWTIQLDRETLPSAIQSGGRARRDRASHDWREADRDPAQRVRRHQWSRSNIDHSVDTALSLSAPRDHPGQRRAALSNPPDAGSGACGLRRILTQRSSVAGRPRYGSQSDHRVDHRKRGQERTLNPHDVVTSLYRPAHRRRGDRGTSATRVRSEATDGFTDGLVPPMDRARPQGSCLDLIDSPAVTTASYQNRDIGMPLDGSRRLSKDTSVDLGNGIFVARDWRAFPAAERV
jgi:hypothetical protein